MLYPELELGLKSRARFPNHTGILLLKHPPHPISNPLPWSGLWGLLKEYMLQNQQNPQNIGYFLAFCFLLK
uniref:Uncharacterized protein n=1 Tax=Anguilla anguilla TaxID=7936 RepID=A0A0E9UW40_ANGAN